MSFIIHVLVRLCLLFNICISLRKSGRGIKDTRASFFIASHRYSLAPFSFLFSFFYWRRQWWWFWLIVTTLKLYSQWPQKKTVLFYSILFYSILQYSVLFYVGAVFIYHSRNGKVILHPKLQEKSCFDITKLVLCRKKILLDYNFFNLWNSHFLCNFFYSLLYTINAL